MACPQNGAKTLISVTRGVLFEAYWGFAKQSLRNCLVTRRHFRSTKPPELRSAAEVLRKTDFARQQMPTRGQRNAVSYSLLSRRPRAERSSVRAFERITSAASSRESPPISVSHTNGSMPSVAQIPKTNRRSSCSGIRPRRGERARAARRAGTACPGPFVATKQLSRSRDPGRGFGRASLGL